MTAQPKCPGCGIKGVEYIISVESIEQSKGGDAWFEIAHCTQCGHVYGVFAKTLKQPTPLSVPSLNMSPRLG